MQISDRILDDLLRKVLRKLLVSKQRVEATRGSARELIGVLLKLARPRARLSRSETRAAEPSVVSGNSSGICPEIINSTSFVTISVNMRMNPRTKKLYMAAMGRGFSASAATIN
jgi:hypothetical protein